MTICGTLLVEVGALFAYASIDKRDGVAVVGAALADPRYLEHALQQQAQKDSSRSDTQQFYAVHAHRISKGEGTVLGYRRFSTGDVLAIDDETYEKVTIWLRDPLPSDSSRIALSNSSKVIGVYTAGGSAWPMRACGGLLRDGTVSTTDTAFGYQVEVHAKIEPVADVASSRPCLQTRVDLSFTAHKVAFDDLNPWLGAAAEHPYGETYR